MNRGSTRLKATEEERDVFDCSGTAKKAACLMQGQTVSDSEIIEQCSQSSKVIVHLLRALENQIICSKSERQFCDIWQLTTRSTSAISSKQKPNTGENDM